MNHRGGNPAAEKHFASAQMLHRQGRLAEAELEYRAALALDADHCDAKEWLGALCLQIGKLDEAIRWLGEAAAQRPENAAFHDNLAAALMRAQRPEDAVAAYRRSLAAAPDAIETRVNLAAVLQRLGHPNEAMELLDRAIPADRHLNAVCRDPSKLPTQEAHCSTVLENCRHILARYPNHAPTHYSMACTMLNLGQVVEACRACERAIVLNPTIPAYYHILIYSGEATHRAAAVDALEQLAGQEAALPEDDRATLHFLLAKAYDDQKRYEDAFTHFQMANAIKRQMIAYDEAREIGRMDAIATAFPPDRLRGLHGAAHASPVPVFILGMVRSGTTLVEQILASHPDVYGAGELTLLNDLVQKGYAGTPFPESCGTLGSDDWRRLGEAYEGQLAAMKPEATRITDKQPTNFQLIGPIRLALPGARIVHVKRDPLDTCFSCYSLKFAGDVGFAYDLGELGRYYKAYEALMDHWRAALPEGTMLEVQYEELVDDLPAQARRIVEYCGLEWDARCLEFYKTKRAVSTASLYQVRRPIYNSSIGRWRPYKEHLRPLLDALDLSSG
jgi:tetratricopeptide (TPR) repeat protein